MASSSKEDNAHRFEPAGVFSFYELPDKRYPQVILSLSSCNLPTSGVDPGACSHNHILIVIFLLRSEVGKLLCYM